MGLLRFCVLVVRTAFSHSLTLAQDFLFCCVLLVGAAIWLAPRFNMSVDLAPWASALNGWTVGAVTFGSIVALRLICAPYWVWQDERTARNLAEAATNNKTQRKQTRVVLGGFLAEGQPLMTRCADEEKPPPSDDAEAWAEKVETFLLGNLDESYIARFRDDSNLPMTGTSIFSQPHRVLWGRLRVRMARLQEFIKELSND